MKIAERQWDVMQKVVVREYKEPVVKVRDMGKKDHFTHESLAITYG